MIPLGDVIPVRTRPYVTFASMALMAVTGAAFAPSPPLFLELLQMASNIFALWIFGGTVEDRMGHGRFAAFCTLCVGIAAAAQMAMNPSAAAAYVIANSAASAVVAAYIVLYPHSKVAVLIPTWLSLRVIEIPATIFVALWFLLQIAGSVGSITSLRLSPLPGVVPSWAHIAGFAAGAGGVFLFRRPERQRVEWWNDVPPAR